MGAKRNRQTGPDTKRTCFFKGFAVAFTLALAACGGESRVEPPADGVIRLSDQFSSDFSLVDGDGRPVSSEDFRGRVMIVYFGFTHCPDVCPMALGTLSAALNELSEAERAELAPVFISVDPERDTPEAVKTYLSFDERIVGLTGDEDAAEAARRSFKVAARRQNLPESALGYEVQHTSLFYVVDRAGAPVYALRDTLTPAELAEVLRRAVRA